MNSVRNWFVRRVIDDSGRRWWTFCAVFAGFLGIVAGAAGIWQVAVVAVIFLQFALLALLLRVRRDSTLQRDLRQQLAALRTPGLGPDISLEIKQVASDLSAQVEELTRIRTSELQRALTNVRHAVTNQVRQTEAMFQLLQRVSPRASMPASGGWAMDAENILSILDLVKDKPGSLVVELGGGTSTIWLGYLLQQVGQGRLVSIDHDPTFADLTRAEVRRHGLEDVVEIRVAALRACELPDHGTAWYDLRVFEDLANIGLLVVDGPPQSVGHLARLPALPLLWERLSEQAIVALDDAHRSDEQRALERWKATFPELRVAARSGRGHLVALAREPTS